MSIMIGTATIKTIDRRVEYVDNHQNYRAKSGICCRVQTSFLRVNGCCCVSVHVPTSFCRREIRPCFLMMSQANAFIQKLLYKMKQTNAVQEVSGDEKKSPFPDSPRS